MKTYFYVHSELWNFSRIVVQILEDFVSAIEWMMIGKFPIAGSI